MLASERQVRSLTSWTTWDEESLKAFSGTAVYATRFPRPTASTSTYRLSLGQVHDSARVRLNGRDLGTLLGPTFTVVVPAGAWADTNTLEVQVTNLMANRIADLDRRQVPWKKFYNVNFPARRPENRDPHGLFTAAAWEPRPSGLLGPVTLVPLTAAAP
jgi:hypothetical protein